MFLIKLQQWTDMQVRYQIDHCLPDFDLAIWFAEGSLEHVLAFAARRIAFQWS